MNKTSSWVLLLLFSVSAVVALRGISFFRDGGGAGRSLLRGVREGAEVLDAADEPPVEASGAVEASRARAPMHGRAQGAATGPGVRVLDFGGNPLEGVQVRQVGFPGEETLAYLGRTDALGEFRSLESSGEESGAANSFPQFWRLTGSEYRMDKVVEVDRQSGGALVEVVLERVERLGLIVATEHGLPLPEFGALVRVKGSGEVLTRFGGASPCRVRYELRERYLGEELEVCAKDYEVAEVVAKSQAEQRGGAIPTVLLRASRQSVSLVLEDYLGQVLGDLPLEWRPSIDEAFREAQTDSRGVVEFDPSGGAPIQMRFKDLVLGSLADQLLEVERSECLTGAVRLPLARASVEVLVPGGEEFESLLVIADCSQGSGELRTSRHSYSPRTQTILLLVEPGSRVSLFAMAYGFGLSDGLAAGEATLSFSELEQGTGRLELEAPARGRLRVDLDSSSEDAFEFTLYGRLVPRHWMGRALQAGREYELAEGDYVLKFPALYSPKTQRVPVELRTAASIAQGRLTEILSETTLPANLRLTLEPGASPVLSRTNWTVELEDREGGHLGTLEWSAEGTGSASPTLLIHPGSHAWVSQPIVPGAYRIRLRSHAGAAKGPPPLDLELAPGATADVRVPLP